MHKIIVFDLDGTLAGVGQGMLPEDLEKLVRLEQMGYRIAVCSGKPTYYLCGFMRQVGLRRPILVGENGATVQFGVALPPQIYRVHPYSPEARAQLRRMREKIEALYPDMWYQPNEVGLTPFPANEAQFDGIQALIDEAPGALDALAVYRHSDSFDFSPKNISKFSGLGLLAAELGLEREDFIAVGDGINDVPMFEFADVAVVIGDRLAYGPAIRFATIGQALEYLASQAI